MTKNGFHCCNCGKEIDPWKDSICPYCNTKQPNKYRAQYLGCDIILETCPECGCEESFYTTSRYFDDCICCNCGAEVYFNDDDKEPMPQFAKIPTVTCPYCNSTNTKKISNASKVGSVALFGIFAFGKVAKEWHCNNCNSDF